MNVRRRKIMDEKKYLESILKGNKKNIRKCRWVGRIKGGKDGKSGQKR